jgi:transcriptional regulator with XRE-family HTH domain
VLPADADWDAVATAITTRLDELKMAQKTLAELSKVSPATIRQLQRNYAAKERNPRTLEALSLALRWPADYLAKVADPAARLNSAGRALEVEVDQLRTGLAALQARVDALEQHGG